MKAQLRLGKVATALKQVIRRASRLALLVFSAVVVWFGISSLQAYGERLGHASSPVSLVALAALLLAHGVSIEVYIARCGWLAMFRRAFPGETTQGQS
ncbi:hypothetical protein PQR34_35945 [Paraburkholderia sediminicola]|uniref:hypothetical protein n=1 Tax=Paraburkholderia sediminicola TaxID=458836 RepID=UPI0038BCA069